MLSRTLETSQQIKKGGKRESCLTNYVNQYVNPLYTRNDWEMTVLVENPFTILHADFLVYCFPNTSTVSSPGGHKTLWFLKMETSTDGSMALNTLSNIMI